MRKGRGVGKSGVEGIRWQEQFDTWQVMHRGVYIASFAESDLELAKVCKKEAEAAGVGGLGAVKEKWQKKPKGRASRAVTIGNLTTHENTDFADLSSHPHAVKPIPAMISAKEPELLPKPRVGMDAINRVAAQHSTAVPEAANADDVELRFLLQVALTASRRAQNDQQLAEASRREAVSSWQKYRKALESAGVDPTILAEAEAHS